VTHYEYDFVRIKFGMFGAGNAEKEYRSVIRARARKGWRLVQIFSPAVSSYGKSSFYEMIFEREKHAEGED
jgi:hypothetical protein